MAFFYLWIIANVTELSVWHIKHTNKYNYQDLQDVKFILKKVSSSKSDCVEIDSNGVYVFFSQNIYFKTTSFIPSWMAKKKINTIVSTKLWPKMKKVQFNQCNILDSVKFWSCFPSFESFLYIMMWKNKPA